MNDFVDVSRLAYRFNADEAVWRGFEEKRELRRRSRTQLPLPDAILDAIDWQDAERERWNVRFIGYLFPCD